MTDATVPDGWTCPPWLALYTRNELRYLAERQDSRLKELRQTIIQLRERLDRSERKEAPDATTS